MPQNPFVVATKTVNADVFVFDTSKHPTKPPLDGICRPQIRLKGHQKEGYGLSWNAKDSGFLISGGEDQLICEWDLQSQISSATPGKAESEPVAVYKAHNGIIEDVTWHPHHASVFASVGDDKMLIYWDKRKDKKPAHEVAAHKKEVNCVAFSPFTEFLVVTGSTDRTVALWDTRNVERKLHSFENHADDVHQVAWSPFKETILGSAAADRRLNIWDLSKIGREQEPEDAEDGPPELLFIHGGHTSKLSDFSWNPNEEWVIASVAEDNIVQIWALGEHIYEDDEDDMPEEAPIPDEELE
mmetsp:Transcript_12690/g.25770  ORF Transcript_12690/g.25770 Transcript_12690/m.25770 type:complete len:299 (-) Transcript_12690:562-1458(-)